MKTALIQTALDLFSFVRHLKSSCQTCLKPGSHEGWILQHLQGAHTPSSSSSGASQQFVFWDAHKLKFLHFNSLKHKLNSLFIPLLLLLFLPCRAETICCAWMKINFSPWWKDASSRLLAASVTADESCLPRGAAPSVSCFISTEH